MTFIINYNTFWFCVVFYIYASTSTDSKKRKPVNMEGFIVGGVEIEIDQFPWLAQITKHDRTHCAGVIVSDRVIMTAAHCIVGDDAGGKLIKPEILLVYLGSSQAYKGDKYYPCKVYPHAKYNGTSKYSYFYDIGLILLKTKIKFNRRVQKSHIIPEHDDFRDEHFTMSVAGWGFTNTYGNPSKKLKMTRMRFVSNKRCNNSQTSDGAPMPVPAHMFCLVADRWSSDCFGDSGSGVMWGNYLVGLVVTGRDVACGSETMPSMYTDVTYFRKWIENSVNILEQKTLCKNMLHYNRNSKNSTQDNVYIHDTQNDFYYGWIGIGLLPRQGGT